MGRCCEYKITLLSNKYLLHTYYVEGTVHLGHKVSKSASSMGFHWHKQKRLRNLKNTGVEVGLNGQDTNIP